MTFSTSGQQFELRVDDQHVTIVEVGAGTRSYRVGDRDVAQRYDMDQMCDGAHGAPLIPWLNRLAQGRDRVPLPGLPARPRRAHRRPPDGGRAKRDHDRDQDKRPPVPVRRATSLPAPGAGLINDCTPHLEADPRIVTDPNREPPV